MTTAKLNFVNNHSEVSGSGSFARDLVRRLGIRGSTNTIWFDTSQERFLSTKNIWYTGLMKRIVTRSAIKIKPGSVYQ